MEETIWKGVLLRVTKTKIIIIYHLKEEILNNSIIISNLSNMSAKVLAPVHAC